MDDLSSCCLWLGRRGHLSHTHNTHSLTVTSLHGVAKCMCEQFLKIDLNIQREEGRGGGEG